MAPYVELTEEEVFAVRAYLRTVPPIRTASPVRDGQTAITPADSAQGRGLYTKYGRRSCYGDLGVGMGDLRHVSTQFLRDAELETWIPRPSRLRPGTKMPDFDGVVRDEDHP
jgi:hypothetical protein